MELRRILLLSLIVAGIGAATVPLHAHPEDTQPGPSTRFRSMDQMTPGDRELACRSQASIAQKAGLLGLEFEAGPWTYEQLVCQILPNHLLLRFTRDKGKGDLSVFTASLSRVSSGGVTVIPIERRGYSMPVPAQGSALTVAKFNSILAEERLNKDPDVFEEAVCYAVVAGGHPQHAIPADDGQSKNEPGPLLVTEGVSISGNIVVHLADDGSLPRPMQWSVTFDRHGRLLMAELTMEGRTVLRPIPAAAQVDGKSIPPSPAVVGKPVPETTLKQRPISAN